MTQSLKTIWLIVRAIGRVGQVATKLTATLNELTDTLAARELAANGLLAQWPSDRLEAKLASTQSDLLRDLITNELTWRANQNSLESRDVLVDYSEAEQVDATVDDYAHLHRPWRDVKMTDREKGKQVYRGWVEGD